MRKPAFCICENKCADQASSVAIQPGLCRTWSETLKTGFLVTRLMSFSICFSAKARGATYDDFSGQFFRIF